MSTRTTAAEQPFQVVTQKRPSGQARKLSSRDRPPIPRSGSEETGPGTSSSSAPGSSGGGGGSSGGGGGRKKHSRDGGGGKHSGSRGGSSVQGRGREAGDTEGGEGGGRGGGGHTNRHSWDPETAQQYQNKIERSQSARFDRGSTSTDTNNRFERLNPDTEAPGDQSVKPSPASGGGRGRKRNSRSVSGGSSYRSRSPKRRSGKESGKGGGSGGGGGGGGGGEKEGGREKESSAAVVSCELEWDSGSHGEQEQPNELIINGGFSPGKETSLTATGTQGPSLEPTSSSMDKTSGASAQGGSGEAGEEEEEVGTVTKEGEETGKDGGKGEESKTRPRLTYTRVQLLALRDHTQSMKKPEGLQRQFFRQGKWCADAWLTPQSTNEETEEPEEGETGGESAVTGKTLPKLKNPTTLSIIREHEGRGYGKVCLSPQRRSFGSGCSWNSSSSSSSSAKDGGHTTTGPSSSSSTNNRDSPFDGNPSETRRGTRSSGFHHTNHTHTHMVINHTPLRDKKGWKGEGGRGRSYGGFKNKEVEEEPEWMSFGPNDRSEFIELVGLEEHERGRDGGGREEERGGGGEGTVVCEEGDEVGEGGSEGGRGGGVSEEEGSTKTSEGSVGVEEGVVVGVVRPVTGGGGGEEGRTATKEPENEFMLDGFDFSTSVSMCQALASDEEDDDDASTNHRGGRGVRGGRTLPQSVTDPNELSSALMKALRVGEAEEAYRHQSGHPVNALTLDEIHERENISHAPHPPSSHSDTADQTAFNRLVAVLQSSGAIQDEPHQQPPLPHKLPRPAVPLTMPHHKLQDYSMSGRLGGVGGRLDSGSFGFMLENEMRFDDEFGGGPSSSSHLPPRGVHPSMALHTHRDPHMPNSSLLREAYGQQQQQHAKPMYPTPHPPPLSSRPSTLHDKWAEAQQQQQQQQRSWMIHPETGAALDYGSGGGRPHVVDHLGLSVMHSHSHHHHTNSGRGGMGRSSSQSWAVEMEQRRRAELQGMREREARERGAAAVRERLMGVGGGDLSLHHHHHHHHQGLASKPNISLLPTAVMRQLHNSNPAHSLSDVASRSSQSSPADRLDQDMGGRSAYPQPPSAGYGYPEGLGGGRAEYSYPTAHSRIPLRPQHRGAMGLYAPPPQYLPIPHGMSSQQQNPYLH